MGGVLWREFLFIYLLFLLDADVNVTCWQQYTNEDKRLV